MFRQDSNPNGNIAGARPSDSEHPYYQGIARRGDGTSDILDFALSYSIHHRVFSRAATAKKRFASIAPGTEDAPPFTSAPTAAWLFAQRTHGRVALSLHSFAMYTMGMESQSSDRYITDSPSALRDSVQNHEGRRSDTDTGSALGTQLTCVRSPGRRYVHRPAPIGRMLFVAVVTSRSRSTAG